MGPDVHHTDGQHLWLNKAGWSVFVLCADDIVSFKLRTE